MPYKLDREVMESVARRGERLLVKYCMANGIHWLVTGSSGGRDSAITLAWVQRACALAAKRKYQLTSVAAILQCESAAKYTKLGILAAKTFGAKIINVDLTDQFRDTLNYLFEYNGSSGPGLDDQIRAILEENDDQLALKDWDWSSKIAKGNLRARLRMITLYHIARKLKTGMVMSTDNLSEFWMAFWTICGDVGDFCLIQNMLKGLELEDFAQYLKVPAKILAQLPDDGLGVMAGGDAAQLGAVYPVVDRVMLALIRKGFKMDGSQRQLKNLPVIGDNGPAATSFYVAPETIEKLAARSLSPVAIAKRHGTRTLSRKQLGLRPLSQIPLD